ncbi:BTB/POZ domain-containing protein At5g47800 isoform X1 [Coffea eugenioides]|uniref:BTB/POZ domain-containing protein At5g47800 isoform X1 n=1 Tax=Coffea eugenioides TaxID=49369 RepID=UPI000F605172|nr:BTB/POZ domain-containing protein At5g47800 isoform X1 [Coffea eugenioides]
MKFMKLGTRPDTFYTEEATRTVISGVPTDLTVRINNISYHLHKLPLLPKCGLLQQLCSVSEESGNVTLELHDIPGGENAFELCAKFCYGITINLSAHNFVSAFCAAKFLRMTEAVEKGNFVAKLEAFFTSCILEGWKDSIVTLRSTGMVPEWSENLGIIRRCIDSILEKILKPPAKVTWSFTYTRLGYERKGHHSVPRDWWTEDVSDLDLDLFRCIIAAVRSTNILPPQLIGEALHVYACRWLPDLTKTSGSSESSGAQSAQRKQQILETIVSLIPVDGGSVSVGFLLRLLSLANLLGVSPVIKAELIRRSGQQLEEAKPNDLLVPSCNCDDHYSYDIDLVGALLESFLRLWKRRSRERQSIKSIINVGKLVDSYLQAVAMDVNMPVQKVVSLAEAVPEIARPQHDQLYKAINIYLKEHPGLAKADKKQLCRILDCQKLPPEIRLHAVRNENLPLRTIVQALFFDQGRGYRGKDQKLPTGEQFRSWQQISQLCTDDMSKPKLRSSKESPEAEGLKHHAPVASKRVNKNLSKSDGRPGMEPTSDTPRHDGAVRDSRKGKEVRDRNNGSKPEHLQILARRTGSHHSQGKS